MIVCIAEKPSVARDIAEVLGAHTRKEGYIEGNGYQVTWTFGHLCTLKEPHEYTPNWKSWNLGSLPMIPPRFGIKLIENPTYEKQFHIIEGLMQNADEIINCGDAGQEGELIQRWVMQKAGARCPVKRLWISSLTEEAIREGFAKLKDQSDFQSLYEAGLSRAMGDWLLGMNATRLYTIKYGQNKQVLSIGRVQTPTLALIVNRQLEIANFQAAGIRRTALRYDNRTEASARYEKAIDPERCDQALDLSMQLFSDLYPEMKVTGLVDEYPRHLKQAEIDVPLSWLERRLGKRLSPDEIKHKMELLGYSITFNGDNMHVVVPTWRSTGDVSIQADIMEEVARMYGYENFEAEPITTTFDGAINQLDKDLERRIKEYLAIRCGMQEIFTYPWMEESYVNAVLQSTEGILSLSTPPSPAERFVRSSLLPNLCKAVVKNERYFDEFSIFETAQVFRDENYTSPYDPREKLPSQRKNVAGAFATTGKDITALFRKAKGVVEMMARYVHMEALTFKQTEKPVWADNVVWLNIYRGDEKVGDLALLAKKVSMACGIKNMNVMLFQLDQDSLVPLKSRTNTFTHLAEYPMTDYDISLLVDGSVQWKDVAQTVRGIKSELLHGAAFVDEYRGKQVPAGKKSLTLRLAIGSKDKTLTSAEIEEVASGVLNKIAKRFGAELRR